MCKMSVILSVFKVISKCADIIFKTIVVVDMR